jgi:hypothetical protein
MLNAMTALEQTISATSHGGEPAEAVEFLAGDKQDAAAKDAHKRTAVREGCGPTAAQPLLPGCASADSEFGIAAMVSIKTRTTPPSNTCKILK